MPARRWTVAGRVLQARHRSVVGRAFQARRLQFQVFAQPARLGSAHRDFGRFRVLHPQDVVPTEPRDDLLDLVDVDEMRAVHAPEHARIEARLQLVERPIVRRAGMLTRDDGDPVVAEGAGDALE